MGGSLGTRLSRLEAVLGPPGENRFARQRREREEALREEAAFVARVPEDLRAEVAAALADPARSGHLGEWWLWPVAEGAAVPAEFPRALVRVMLDDPDASTLHECGRCGLRVPIRPGLAQPHKPAVSLFDACSACGGPVGYYAYAHARRAERGEGGREAR